MKDKSLFFQQKNIGLQFKNIPKPVQFFILKCLVIFLAWNICYYYFLQPSGQPDQFLTHLTGDYSSQILNNFFPLLQVDTINSTDESSLYSNEHKLIRIAHSCNALELYVLYSAFIICVPGSILKRIFFIQIGILLIFLLNISRITGLAWLHVYHRDWVPISHKYIFKTVVYLFVFLFWYLYSKRTMFEVRK
jgi:exosortase family protein XrtF